VCRRKMLLNDFGEDYLHDNCGKCDNCPLPQKTIRGKGRMCLVLKRFNQSLENSIRNICKY
jgi:ATP-dependent DNA helicase RecQ